MPKINNRGFTLIELLIVIIIISILVTLLAVSYTTIQRNSRDTQRRGDLTTVAGNLERFYSDNSHYPSSDAGEMAYESDCMVGTSVSPEWGTEAFECGGNSYNRQLPEDPTGSAQYCYVSLNSNQQYYLFAQLEGRGNADPTAPENQCNGIGYNYKLTSND